MDSHELARLCAEFLYQKKAEDVVILEIKKLTDIADYFVICTAVTPNHIKSMTNDLERELKNAGFKAWHIEGRKAMKWVLVDLIEVVIHIFLEDHREFYNLESLWGDAPSETIGDNELD
ncbi:ribosome silencing factor [bacterium]|nr:ribosome silencing factor [bacterium]